MLQRVEQFEAKSILLRGPLNQLAHLEHHRANPVARLMLLLALVQVHRAGPKFTKVLVPLLKIGPNLEPVRHHNDGGILNRRDELIGELLLLQSIILSAVLVRRLMMIMPGLAGTIEVIMVLIWTVIVVAICKKKIVKQCK